MKTLQILPFLTAIGLAASANGASILLGGFDGSNAVTSPLQDASASGNVSVELNSGSGLTIGLNPGAFQQGNFSTWGLQTFTPNPQATGGNSVAMIDGASGSFNMVVTNTSETNDLTLNALHWVAKRDVGTFHNFVNFSYLSGDLTGGSASGLMTSSIAGYDFDLTTILTDNVLAPSETATFSFSFPDGSADVNSRMRLDNVAISGEFAAVVPEPSSMALLGLGFAGLLLRRRR